MKTLILAAALAAWTLPALGQARNEAGTARIPAEARQFDFLLGQWQVEVRPKASGVAAMIHGAPRLQGTWKAWRALDGLAIEDELRIVDGSGNPISLTSGIRIYSKAEARWKVSGLDAYRARFNEALGGLEGGEMRLAGRGVDPEGRPMLTRTRYYDVTPNGFRMRQDRSTDNGQTWDEGAVEMIATRTAAAAAR
ncbi:MAG TPA: hypothetical protein VLT89_01815 [Usitatibacter sp.]|nr:hypothetical protein [Usitatibacter sp.]